MAGVMFLSGTDIKNAQKTSDCEWKNEYARYEHKLQ